MISKFPSCSQMPVVFYHSLIHGFKDENFGIKTELTAIMDLCLKENINVFNLARVELEHAVASKDLNGKL